MATETMEKPAEKPAEKATDQKPLFADNGLGMSEFLKPSGEEKADATATVPVAEIPPEAKSETGEAKSDKPAVGTDEPAKAVVDPAPKDEAKELTKLQKQLKDTRDAFTQERQVNKTMLAKVGSLEQAIAILTKKIDGTYDEAKDAPKVLTPQEIEVEADTRATVRTSHFAAVEYLMARDHLTEADADAKVKELVWSDEAPFRAFDQDRAVQARVLGAKVPIIEALKVVQEAADKQKYGADPAAMRDAIRKELEPQIEAKTREKLLKELKGKGVVLEELKGLGGVQSVSPERAPQAEARVTLESLFPNFKGAG
jgi:hypothetical protein